MKIAIYNEFFGDQCAETQLAQRICLAAINLGWEALEVCSSVEVKRFHPDFVLALHFSSPKLTGFPTYGCMWNPPFFLKHSEVLLKEEFLLKNILSYDAYLSPSKKIDFWLRDILYCTNKKNFISPFYPSFYLTHYQPPCLENPHLVYLENDCNSLPFQELLMNLDAQKFIKIYNYQNQEAISLKHSYQGTLPLDGASILKTLNQAGVGLCLHREEYYEAEVPSRSVFEIVASGAVAICEEHPFIKKVFGDSVLYIDSNLSTTEKIVQISRYMGWIQNNQREALQMSEKAHSIFLQKYTLENLLLGIVPHHQELIRKKGFVTVVSNSTISDKQVQLIVRVGGRDAAMVKRALDSIANQSYYNIGVIIVKYKEVQGLDTLLKEYESKLSIKVIESEYSGFRSTQLWSGINAVSSEYFGILDDDDIIHSNHVYSLVSLLEKFKNIGVAYSGSICVWEPGQNRDLQQNRLALIKEPAKLAYFEPFDINKMMIFDNFIVSNSFIAKTYLIDESLREDPQFSVAEDLFLLLNFCRITKFIFSYEATCEYYWRDCKQDNSTFKELQSWEDSYERIRHIFGKKDFPSSQYIAVPIKLNPESNHSNSELEELRVQLQQAHNIIAAMKSSKFWKFRTAWFRLRKLLKIPTREQLL